MPYADFDAFWESFLARAPGDFIDYELSRPKHEFLGYLVRERGVVLHGSNSADLDLIEPRPAYGTGNDQSLLAVYATEDPTTATFVAVLNRANLTHWDVSLANDRFALGLRDGALSPWTEGVVYLLDVDPFEKLGNWVCYDAVCPLGKLRVRAEDLPNLDRIELRTTPDENRAFHLVAETVEDAMVRNQLRTRRDGEYYSILLSVGGDAHLLFRCLFTESMRQVVLLDPADHEIPVSLDTVEDLRQHAELIGKRIAHLLNPP